MMFLNKKKTASKTVNENENILFSKEFLLFNTLDANSAKFLTLVIKVQSYVIFVIVKRFLQKICSEYLTLSLS